MPVKKEIYYTIEELTKKLSLSKDTVTYWIREGNLKIFISETDLENFLNRKREDDERSARLKKKTKEREEILKKRSQEFPNIYKKFNGRITEL